MNSFVIKRGNASVKEEGLRAFLWPVRWLVLREQTLSFHKNEVGFGEEHFDTLFACMRGE